MVWEMTEGLVLSPQLCRCCISVIGEKIAEHEIKVVNLPASQHFYPHIWPWAVFFNTHHFCCPAPLVQSEEFSNLGWTHSRAASTDASV